MVMYKDPKDISVQISVRMSAGLLADLNKLVEKMSESDPTVDRNKFISLCIKKVLYEA